MTTITETPSGVDFTGRAAVRDGGAIATVSAVRDGLVYFSDDPDAGVAEARVVPLPMVGERIDVTTKDGAVQGVWLGVSSRHTLDGSVRALVLVGQDVRRVTLTTSQADARAVLRGFAPLPERTYLDALANEARARDTQDEAHRRWRDNLVADAHEYADSNDLCGRFDEFMDDHGLPARSHDYNLRVEVTATVWVSASGRTAEAAIDALTPDEVFARLTPSGIEYEAEED